MSLDHDQTMVKVPVRSIYDKYPSSPTSLSQTDKNTGTRPVSQLMRSAHEHTIGTLSTVNTDSRADIRSVSTPNDNMTVTLSKDSRPVDDDLQGYTQVTRPRYAPFFASGVKIKNDSIDDTIQAIYTYIKKSNEHIKVRSLKIVKQSGDYMSAKLVILAEHLDCVLDREFWSLGIYCRKWIN